MAYGQAVNQHHDNTIVSTMQVSQLALESIVTSILFSSHFAHVVYKQLRMLKSKIAKSKSGAGPEIDRSTTWRAIGMIYNPTNGSSLLVSSRSHHTFKYQISHAVCS